MVTMIVTSHPGGREVSRFRSIAAAKAAASSIRKPWTSVSVRRNGNLRFERVVFGDGRCVDREVA